MDCTALELKEKLAAGEDFLLLDVRTPEEFGIVRLEPAKLVPLHDLAARLDDLAEWRGREVVCLCHHGIRSAQACAFLKSKGFTNVRNMTGGIDAYAVEANQALTRY